MTDPSSAFPASTAQPLADAVLMVRPAAFGPNPETARTNRFQSSLVPDAAAADAAAREFDLVAGRLAAAGIEVLIAEDTPVPAKPDAVFPNNWFTTHADGTLVLYPMLAPSRSSERRPDALEALATRSGRRLAAVVDLSRWEAEGQALEGTGSLVLDRGRRVAYACLSPRTCAAPLAQWARLLGYEVEAFRAVDAAGVPVYHTNVMLALGRGFAVACLESVADSGERDALRERLARGGAEIFEISRAQMAGFTANLLHLEGAQGAVIAISSAGLESLGRAVAARLERYGRIVAAPIPTIERFGGGSVRCMLAEIFLPRRKPSP